MKKVFQTKLKNITKILALVIVASLATFMGCKSYDSDISQLNTDIVTLRTDLTTQMNNLNSATTTALNAQIATLTTQLTAHQTQLTSLQTQLTALQASAATKAQIDALQTQIDVLKASIVTNTASIAALQAFQATATAQILLLQTQIAAAPKQSDLTALQTTVNSFITSTNTTLTALGVRVTTVETNLTAAQANIATLQGNVAAQLLLINGLQTAVAALQTTTTTQGTAITALQTTVTSQGVSITALQASVASQLVLITANTTAITKLQTDLTALQTSVNTTTAANTAAIAALQTKFAGITDNFKALARAMSLNFAALSSRLTSMEFVADFNVNGIAAMNFSPLNSQCGAITPFVTVAYHLNPSFITAADIETGNMSFVVLPTSNIIFTGLQPAKAVADAPKIRAIFNRIQDGKIYVDVKVDDITVLASSLSQYGVTSLLETFNSIALQVPLSQKAVQENAITFDANDGIVVVGSQTYPTNRVITSAYVRLYNKSLTAMTDVFIAKKTITGYPFYPITLAGAKALFVKDPLDNITQGTTDPLVINIPYSATGQPFDLMPYVINVLSNHTAFDAAGIYGLAFKFDKRITNYTNFNLLGDTISYKIVGNLTEQENFIDVTPAGLVTRRVYDIPGQDAGTNRTPIVRVIAYNKNGDVNCPVLYAYIKLNLEAKPRPTPITVDPLTFTSMEPTCDSIEGRTTVQWMNEKLYQTATNLSKEDFHTIYTMSYSSTMVPASYGGKVQQIKDPNVTDSYILSWKVSSADVWAALFNNPSASYVDFTTTVTYTPSLLTLYPIINVTFTRRFTKPSTLNLTSTISNYWYSLSPNTVNSPATVMPWNYVKHNIYVPNVGETNGALAIFSNNINQAFEQNANKSLLGLANYEYYFVPNTGTQPNDNSQPVFSVNGVTYQLTPSADGQTLWNGGDLVATINPFVANTGNVLVLNQSSPTAKLLLNYDKEFLRVRIGIRTVYCLSLPTFKMPVTVNGKPYFDVIFVRPINPQPAADQYFVDALNLGDPHTYLEIAKFTNLWDWRFSDPVASFATHFNYWSYYGVTNITANVAGIRTDLNQAAGVTVPLAQYPDLRVYYALAVPGVTNPTATTPPTFFGYLTYQNTGNTLGKLFNLYVPVTITYSWGTIQSAQVVIPVWKTVGNSGVKRK